MTFEDLYNHAVAAQANGEYLHLEEGGRGRVAIQPLQGGVVRIIDMDHPDQGTVLDPASYERSHYKGWRIAGNPKVVFNRLGVRHGA